MAIVISVSANDADTLSICTIIFNIREAAIKPFKRSSSENNSYLRRLFTNEEIENDEQLRAAASQESLTRKTLYGMEEMCNANPGDTLKFVLDESLATPWYKLRG